jgi:hypothetical protein
VRPNIAEPQSGPQKSLGIDRFVIDPCFVMQMRTSRAAGRADLAEVCPIRTWSPTLTRLMMRSTCARNSAMRSS